MNIPPIVHARVAPAAQGHARVAPAARLERAEAGTVKLKIAFEDFFRGRRRLHRGCGILCSSS